LINKEENQARFVPPTGEQYMEKRLWNRIFRFHKKGVNNRRSYHFSQTIIILAAALITISNTVDLGSTEIRIISSVLGGIVIVFTSIQQLFKFQENWILFRTTEEALRREYHLYITKAGEYADLPESELKPTIVEKVEALLLSQYSSFFGMHKAKPKSRVQPPSGGKSTPDKG